MFILGGIAFAGLLLYLVQDKLIFYPERLPENYSFRFDAAYEERFFNASDGTRIHALLFRRADSKGLVYYHHGNAGSLRDWGSVYPEFTDRGFDLLIYDFRGYGKSGGSRNEAVLLADALLIYDLAADEYADRPIIIYGRSLGTGIAGYVASQRRADALILESPYRDFRSLARYHMPWVPGFMVRYHLPLIHYIEAVDSPVYLIHGTGDDIVPYRASAQLKEAFPEKVRLFTVQGGGHNDLDMHPAYRYALDEIFGTTRSE